MVQNSCLCQGMEDLGCGQFTQIFLHFCCPSWPLMCLLPSFPPLYLTTSKEIFDLPQSCTFSALSRVQKRLLG
jgi:hypothetical protein